MTNPEDFSDRPYEGWYFHFTEQWSALFQKCNWYDFTVIKLHVENDVIMGGIEFELFLLGLGIRVRYNHTRTPMVDELTKRMNEVMENPERLRDIFGPKDDDGNQ